MTITQLKNKFLQELSDNYPKEEILSFFNLLSEKFVNITRLQIALEPNKELSDAEILQFESAIVRLKEFEPIQYIIGETEFFSLNFKVAPGVLIPRPETEELVQWILDEVSLQQNQNLQILDIGTGSGCIPISLKKHLSNAQISAGGQCGVGFQIVQRAGKVFGHTFGGVGRLEAIAGLNRDQIIAVFDAQPRGL